jgi:uncharacterized protein
LLTLQNSRDLKTIENMKTKSQPVAPSKRIELIDALRGFAILGILMVNMQVFFQPVTTLLMGYQGAESTTDLLSQIFIKFFFEGKFYVLFSLLFGYGFFIFMNKTTQNGGSIAPVFARRVNILLVFGLLHVLLLWAGDILVWYALFGLLLLAFRKVSNRGLVKWAVGFILIPILSLSLMVSFLHLGLQSEMGPEIAASMQANFEQSQAFLAEASVVYSSGSFTEIMSIRLREYSKMLPGIIFFYPVVLAMFLLGYWAARNEIISKFTEKLDFWRKALIIGGSIGIPLQVFYVYGYLQTSNLQFPDFTSLVVNFSHIIGGFFLSLFYISSIVLLVSKGKLHGFLKYLSPVGRMALTNYLLHSIICTSIFYGFGLGMLGQIAHLQGIFLTIAIFILQIPFSWYWLKTSRYGPMEWLWRSLTYGKLQPMRKPGSEEVISPAL